MILAQRGDEFEVLERFGGLRVELRVQEGRGRKREERGSRENDFAGPPVPSRVPARRAGPLAGAGMGDADVSNPRSFCDFALSQRCALVFQRRRGLLFESTRLESDTGKGAERWISKGDSRWNSPALLAHWQFESGDEELGGVVGGALGGPH